MTGKNTYGWFIIVLTLLSCTIDEDPKSFITPNEFLQEDRDAQSVVDAIYSHINSGSSIYSKYYWMVNAIASDMAEYQGGQSDLAEFSTFSISPDNKVVAALWQGLYAAINTTNYAIQSIPQVPITDGEKIPFIAEARFFRGLFYFDLMRFFGGVPISTDVYTTYGNAYRTSRAPLDSVEVFVEREFSFAFENLPKTNDPGRPNAMTAAAFLAKFYLTIGEYNRAFGASRLVIQSSQFNLHPDFATNFKIGAQNTIEDIFSINLNADDGSMINILSLPSVLGGQGFILPTEKMYTSFDELDRRRMITFLDQYSDSNGNMVNISPHVSKYWDQVGEPTVGKTANDIPFFRYADILLLHAEAINALRNGSNAEALQVINTVRARARFDGQMNQSVLPDLIPMKKDDFRNAILEERKRELAWEGHRWFDLVRMGVLKEIVTLAKPDSKVSQNHNLLPIPQRELTINPGLGEQNPGY